MNEPQPHTENPRPDAAIKPGDPPQSGLPAQAALPAADRSIAYRPVSGWAIAGFGIGALFAVLVAISTAVALAQGAPMFFPVWILGLAIVGIIFSLIGQRQIQDSEGTRAGAKLARFGVWLSLLSGLGYLSYYYVTGLALQSQANTFLMEKSDDGGFFPLLTEGATKPAQLNAAFLLTLPAIARNCRPEEERKMLEIYDQPAKDGAPGPLTQFREGVVPRLLYKGLAKDAEITPLGVQDWKYEMRSYKIYRNYRITTKELEVEMQFAVFSTEAEAAGKDRKWFVNMKESFPIFKTMKLTPTGNGIKLLRHLASLWLQLHIQELNKGNAFPEIIDTDKSPWGQDFVHVRGGNRETVRAFVHQAFSSAAKNRIKQFNVITGQDDVGKWETLDGKIRIPLNFRFGLDKELGGGPFANVIGYAVLQTKLPIDPATFDPQAPLPEWDIAELVFTAVLPVGTGKAQ